MRGVKEGHPLTLQRQWDPKLLGHGVIASCFEYGAEILSQRLNLRSIFRTTEQDEFRVVIQTRKLSQQVTNVRADAEIVQFSRVDADAHPRHHSGRSQW